MIKKTITAKQHFANEGDEPEARDLYFNLTKAEAFEINLMENLEAVGRSNNPRKIIPVFKRILRAAYGVRLPTGVFSKDEDDTADFLASNYYSELLIEMLQGGEKVMADFIKEILDFNVSDLNEENKPAPTRPEPQDYKPSAREIAARAAAEKEIPVEQPRHVDPAEAKKVQNYPSTDTSIRFEDSPEYKQFMARQAAQDTVDSTPVNIGDQPIEVHPAPAITPVSDDERTAKPPFTNN